MTASSRQRKMVSRDDVARVAGVAPTTVSLVLNGRAARVKLADTTRRRVETTARELGYVPNAAARALGRQRSRAIGLLLSAPKQDPHVPVFADIAVAAIERSKQLGHFVLLLPAMPEDSGDVLTAVRDADIAGLVCQAGGISQSFGEAMAQTGMPVVWMRQGDVARMSPEGPSVEIDSRRGIDQLGKHLCARGYTSLGVVAGPRVLAFPTSARYRSLLQQFSDDVSHVEAGAWSSEAGRQAMHSLLHDRPPPAAIFAANDLLATGVLHACREVGLRVPGDIGLAGFGDFRIGADLDPPLTTVHWPLAELAGRAVERLIAGFDDDLPARRQVLHTRLVIREST